MSERETVKCPRCGEAEPHFVPPSFGEEGFFICERPLAPPVSRAAGGEREGDSTGWLLEYAEEVELDNGFGPEKRPTWVESLVVPIVAPRQELYCVPKPTHDHMKAMRFARREDAEKAIGLLSPLYRLGPAIRPTEHMWMTRALSSAPAPEERREIEAFTEAEWESLLWSLQSRAPYIAARFGAPVYLVGSALNWRERPPRDIDIRIVLPDADWEARFGGNALHFNAECSPTYVAEVGKLTRDLVRDFQRNIDIQVQPESWLTRHNARDKPRLLLADCSASPSGAGSPVADNRAIVPLLMGHWLTAVECDHATNTDKACCWCGWASDSLPTVGDAVCAWAEHVASFAAPPAAGREPSEVTEAMVEREWNATRTPEMAEWRKLNAGSRAWQLGWAIRIAALGASAQTNTGEGR